VPPDLGAGTLKADALAAVTESVQKKAEALSDDEL